MSSQALAYFTRSIVIVTIFVSAAAAIVYKSGVTRQASSTELPVVNYLASPTFTPTPEPTQTPEPTLTPTLAPTPTNTPKPTPVASPTPKLLSGPPGAGLSTVSVSTPKGNFKATVLSLDLTTAKMITDGANDDDCKDNCATMSLKDFVNRNSGFSGVNGTYFCPASYPDCSAKKDSYDFPIYNSRLHKWINGGNLGWGSRSLFYTQGTQAQYRQSSTDYPSAPDAALINYPGLVNGGNVQIEDNQSGLSDKQRSVGTKVGIGTRGGSNVMVVVAYNVNMQQFAYVFQSLGATGALNLDTGGSTALINNGSYVLGPGRNIPNAVIFARR